MVAAGFLRSQKKNEFLGVGLRTKFVCWCQRRGDSVFSGWLSIHKPTARLKFSDYTCVKKKKKHTHTRLQKDGLLLVLVNLAIHQKNATVFASHAPVLTESSSETN